MLRKLNCKPYSFLMVCATSAQRMLLISDCHLKSKPCCMLYAGRASADPQVIVEKHQEYAPCRRAGSTSLLESSQIKSAPAHKLEATIAHIHFQVKCARRVGNPPRAPIPPPDPSLAQL